MNTHVTVVICTVGRPEVLHETVFSVLASDRVPDDIILCAPNDRSVYSETAALKGVRSLVCPRKGLTIQRNYAIDHLLPAESGLVCFLDDDVELGVDYLGQLETVFAQQPEVIGLSAQTLFDEDVGRLEAKRLVAKAERLPAEDLVVRSTGRLWTCHGCNMTFRRSLLEVERFDERLPLYSYAEDLDMAVRAAKHGKVGKVDRGMAIGHLESRSARISELRRGYSMVANNFYFLRKRVSHLPIWLGFLRFWLVIVLKESWHDLRMSRADLVGTKEEGFDFKGRLRGRMLAVRDIFAGKARPERILELSE